jgi:hypothetical protein
MTGFPSCVLPKTGGVIGPVHTRQIMYYIKFKLLSSFLQGELLTIGKKDLTFKGTVSQDFWLQIFYDSSSFKPLKITLGSFQIFSIICGDIRKSRCTTGITYNGGKFCHQ